MTDESKISKTISNKKWFEQKYQDTIYATILEKTGLFLIYLFGFLTYYSFVFIFRATMKLFKWMFKKFDKMK